jgi:hypothetical protein
VLVVTAIFQGLDDDGSSMGRVYTVAEMKIETVTQGPLEFVSAVRRFLRSAAPSRRAARCDPFRHPLPSRR